MIETTDLRKLLVNFRETVIYQEWHSDLSSRKHCILRRAMIDWLLESQPETEVEWLMALPPRLARQTDKRQFEQYSIQILALINRHKLPQRLRAA